jgi:ATP-dependent DNA helicase RecQ
MKFLKEKETIDLPKMQEDETNEYEAPRQKAQKTPQASQNDFEYDEECFEMLRSLRRELADKKNVPAFVIFSDAALRHMAHALPQTPEEFLKISGVGAKKQEEYGEVFTKAIKDFVKYGF